jgi:FkbM family methyltransferase
MPKHFHHFKNIWVEFIQYLHLFKEGKSIKDKTIIFLYFLLAPYRILQKASGFKVHRQYVKAISLENADGLFNCGRSFISSRIACEFYEKDLHKYLNLKEGVFVDVGAHIGKYTVALGNKIGKSGIIISIEPETENFNLLKKNVALNKLTNVHLQNVACAGQEGEATLYVHKDRPTLHSFYLNRGPSQIKVKTVKLDTIIQDLKINRVDLLKIDVEGAEIDVIKGSSDTLKKHHPRIVFEVFDSENLKKIEEVLCNFDYIIKQIKEKNYFAY